MNTKPQRPTWWLIDDDERIKGGPYKYEEEAETASYGHPGLFPEYGRPYVGDNAGYLEVLKWPEDRPGPEFVEGTPPYTAAAVTAVLAAIAAGEDMGGWLASVLRTAGAYAAEPDSLSDPVYVLIESRPGSWEAPHLRDLAEGGQSLLVEEPAGQTNRNE